MLRRLILIKGVGDIIPEGALYVYDDSRLNYMYVWLFSFSFFFWLCLKLKNKKLYCGNRLNSKTLESSLLCFFQCSWWCSVFIPASSAIHAPFISLSHGISQTKMLQLSSCSECFADMLQRRVENKRCVLGDGWAEAQRSGRSFLTCECCVI